MTARDVAVSDDPLLALAAQIAAMRGDYDDKLRTLFARVGGTALTFAAFQVDTNEGTTSTSYTDLVTAGPAVTVTTGTKALVFLAAGINIAATPTAYAVMSFAVSGATVEAPSDSRAVAVRGLDVQFGSIVYLDDLTPGANTFTAKYRTSAGTATFGNRLIGVLNLGS